MLTDKAKELMISNLVEMNQRTREIGGRTGDVVGNMLQIDIAAFTNDVTYSLRNHKKYIEELTTDLEKLQVLGQNLATQAATIKALIESEADEKPKKVKYYNS